MEPSETSELVRDTELNAKVTLTSTEHVFNRRGRPGGPREVWHRKSRLGHGSFGTVWLETCEQPYRRDSPPVRAVKEIHLEPGSAQNIDYTRELLAFAKFSQPKFEPYFVRSFGWYATSDSVFITMAYHPLGDLQQYLFAPIPEPEAKHITEQLLEGLKHMHDNGFAHRDLKPKNVLVVSRGPSWSVQITDFGISKKIQDGQTAQGTLYQGSAGFMAPEMLIPSLRGSHYAVDLWSLGSMAYYMLTNRLPFRDFADLQRYGTGTNESISGDYTGVDITENAKGFITPLLARKPQDRPSADQALSSEWMADFSMDALPASSAQNLQDLRSTPNYSLSDFGSEEQDLDFASKTWRTELSVTQTPTATPRHPTNETQHANGNQGTITLPLRNAVNSSSVEIANPTGNVKNETTKTSVVQPRSNPAPPTATFEKPRTGFRNRIFGKTSDREREKRYTEEASTARLFIKTLTDRTYTLHVILSDPVFRIKEEIEKSEGIPVDQQRLVFKGTQLDDNAAIAHYGIRNEDTVHLILTLKRDPTPKPRTENSGKSFTRTTARIFVKTLTGKTFTYRITLSSPILAIKEAIHGDQGIPVDQQRLIFGGKQLDNDATPREYGIRDDDTVHLVLRLRGDNVTETGSGGPGKTYIYVKTLTDKTFICHIDLSDPVLSIKEAIQRDEGIPVDQQRLIFAGRQLEDDKPIRDYGIFQKSTLHLVLRLRQH